MAVWNEITGVTLETSDLTDEQMNKLLAGMTKEKFNELMAGLDKLATELKQEKELIKFTQRVLQLFLLKIITL